MSLSATGGGSTAGEIASVVQQMIEQILRSASISSAGGDSPKVNKFVDFDSKGADFGSILDQAVQTAVIRHMEDAGLFGELDGDITTASAGVTGNQKLALARQGISKLQNPESLINDALGFLPQATLIGFALSLLPIIMDELTKPGGPFDLRFKRAVEKEFNALMDRQTAHDVAIGERGLIFQSRAGFINRNGGAANTNTLRMIREGGINKEFLNEIDYVDHSRGLF